MVNKPLIRPYFLEGVALGGAARITLITSKLQSPEISQHVKTEIGRICEKK